jgi:hypothetical protein
MTKRLSNDYWNEAKSQRGLTEKSDMTGYWNEIDPKETRKIIQNERDCFRTRAEADAALEASGRFKRQNETQIVGSGPPTYPTQPTSSPWGGDNPIPAGGELDYFDTDISAVDPIIPERREATSANGLTSTVEHAPESPAKEGIAEVGLSTRTASGVVGSYDAGTETVEAVFSSPPSIVSTPNSKSWRRF